MHTPVLACACHGAFVVVVVVWAVGGVEGGRQWDDAAATAAADRFTCPCL